VNVERPLKKGARNTLVRTIATRECGTGEKDGPAARRIGVADMATWAVRMAVAHHIVRRMTAMLDTAGGAQDGR